MAVGRDTIGYSETKGIFANHTMMSYDSAHGTQVEFIASTGRTYLLYPGNTVIVKGSWRLDRTEKSDVFNICFRYPSNSSNPATGNAGGDWECQIAGFYLGALREIIPGDQLGLSRGSEVPFVLSRARTNFTSLLRKLAQ
ncbi:MAG: hypothetical protein JWR51_3944 [Devosia sp.]|nr:hypothetical protein [Devosia sp.]